MSGLPVASNDAHEGSPAASGLGPARPIGGNDSVGGRRRGRLRLGGRSSRQGTDAEAEEPEEVAPATCIALQPVDRDTGEAIEPDEVVEGYEFERGQFVTFTPAELKALD